MLAKRISLLELGGLALLSWLFIWHWGPQIKSYHTTWMAAGFLATILYISYLSPVWIHGDNHGYRGLGGWQTLFIRTDNFVSALYRFGAITVVGGLLIIIASLIKNPSIFQQLNWQVFFIRLFCYAISSVVQGFVTMFILMRLIDVSACDPFEENGNPRAEMNSKILIITLITCYFSLVHTPNIGVMVVSVLFTPFVLWHYFKTPNFFMLVTTHTILGTLLHRVYELSMRIGPFYNHPDTYVIRELFPPLARLIGNSW